MKWLGKNSMTDSLRFKQESFDAIWVYRDIKQIKMPQLIP